MDIGGESIEAQDAETIPSIERALSCTELEISKQAQQEVFSVNYVLAALTYFQPTSEPQVTQKTFSQTWRPDALEFSGCVQDVQKRISGCIQQYMVNPRRLFSLLV